MKGDEFIGDPCEGKIFISEKLNAQFIVPEKGIFQNLKDVAISTPSEVIKDLYLTKIFN